MNAIFDVFVHILFFLKQWRYKMNCKNCGKLKLKNWSILILFKYSLEEVFSNKVSLPNKILVLSKLGNSQCIRWDGPVFEMTSNTNWSKFSVSVITVFPCYNFPILVRALWKIQKLKSLESQRDNINNILMVHKLMLSRSIDKHHRDVKGLSWWGKALTRESYFST